MKIFKKSKKKIIYGYHSVKKAIEVGIRLEKKNQTKLFITQNKYNDIAHETWIKDYNNLIFSTIEQLNIMTNTTSHNSIALEVDYYEMSVDLKDLGSKILILDNITDSGNLGAVIRSAAVFGYDVILPNHNSATINGVVAKNAAGGLEFVKIHYCNSLLQTVKNLKKDNYFIIGAIELTKNISHIPSILNVKNTPNKISIIMGSEDIGIRNSLIEELDFSYSIKGRDGFNILNVSVAAAIIMYECSNLENKI